MNIVLHQPEIPHNTGAIGRTCLVTGAKLHLIRPYGFYLDEKSLKRAGMDYWGKIDVREYDNFAEFLKAIPEGDGLLPVRERLHFVETGSAKTYVDIKYGMDDYIIFGSETAGLPRWIMDEYKDRVVTIPMLGDARSLNLSVAVGVVVYEALRQGGFWGG